MPIFDLAITDEYANKVKHVRYLINFSLKILINIKAR